MEQLGWEFSTVLHCQSPRSFWTTLLGTGWLLGMVQGQELDSTILWVPSSSAFCVILWWLSHFQQDLNPHL